MNLLKHTPTFYRLSQPLTLLSNQILARPLSPALRYRPIFTFCDRKGMPDKGDTIMGRQQRLKQKTEEMMNEVPEDEEDQSSYKKGENRVTVYIMGISVLALFIAYAMMEVQNIRVDKKVDKSITGMTKVSSSGKAYIGGEWKLVNTKGEQFGSRDLEGTYYLIYFGFTNCPDICPNSLIKLSKALQKIRKMPERDYITLKTIFVSVDPERDTPQKIQKFLSYFDPSMIGVTGPEEDLKECMKKFKIYASRIEFEDEESVVKGRKSYTIDHTILTYLMSDSNEYLAHLGANLGEHELAKIIVEKILENEQNKMKILKT